MTFLARRCLNMCASKRQLVRGGDDDDGGDGGLYCRDGVCDGRSETEPSPGESRAGRKKTTNTY